MANYDIVEFILWMMQHLIDNLQFLYKLKANVGYFFFLNWKVLSSKTFTVLFNPFRMKTPKYLFLIGNKPLLYHQIGNTNFFFFTNQ